MTERCYNYFWLYRKKKRTATVLSVTHPMIKAEIERKIKEDYGFSENTDIELDGFIKRNIISCINPNVRQGKVFVLPKHGLRLTRKLAKEQDIKWSYIEPAIDLKVYGWLICGKRRKIKLLEIVKEGAVTKAKNSANADAKLLTSDTSRSYSYELLNAFVEKGLVKKIKSNGVNIFVSTNKAKKIAGYINMFRSKTCKKDCEN